MVIKGGYGYNIPIDCLPRAEEKAQEMGTTMYVEYTDDCGQAIVSCGFSPRSPKRMEFDSFLEALCAKGTDATQVQ
jgi:hypothetical protein